MGRGIRVGPGRVTPAGRAVAPAVRAILAAAIPAVVVPAAGWEVPVVVVLPGVAWVVPVGVAPAVAWVVPVGVAPAVGWAARVVGWAARVVGWVVRVRAVPVVAWVAQVRALADPAIPDRAECAPPVRPAEPLTAKRPHPRIGVWPFVFERCVFIVGRRWALRCGRVETGCRVSIRRRPVFRLPGQHPSQF
ncbi:hypothetical protein [Nocardia sp. alder85J]|uniref:hypothetical protein n=1 Tax=Nocardia sp. alder85J TaxID=2862949 RepID=UPI001CD36A80|nr:hypothetical protein [Nocardia sp. alder85J]MCX4091442.1 hypothetical protein [Nocardia sp. alder85J]